MTRRWIGAPIMAAMLMAVLAGCDTHLADGPIQIRIVDGELRVRPCIDVSATSILVEVRNEGEWETVWKASGDPRLTPDVELSTSGLSEKFPQVAVAEDPSVDIGSDVSVLIYADGANQLAAFEVDENALDGEWIDPNPDEPQSCSK